MKRTFKINITNKADKNLLTNFIFKYRHFENVYLLFIESCDKIDFNIITNYGIMRSVLINTKGGKNIDNIKYINGKYGNNEWLIVLKDLVKELKIHNVCCLINRLKGQYKTFFTNIKKGIKTNKPSTKKLKYISEYSIILDNYTSWTLKRKNILGLNLNDKMFYLNMNHESLNKICGDIKNISAIVIKFKNNSIYLCITYDIIENVTENKEEKLAGGDLGINNLMSIFINDKTTKSIIVDGTPFKSYNSNFNRFISKLDETISNEVTEFKESKKKNDDGVATKYASKWTKRGHELKKFKTYLYEKRNRYFEDQLHKMSKRIVEYLIINDVTELILSKNLAKLKNNGLCNLKASRQNFIQIPIIKLLNYIEYKCTQRGIKVEYINESYTSMCSCLSDNCNNPYQVLNGIRKHRGLFLDKKYNLLFNADLNGAVNHIKKKTDEDFCWIKDYMFKLCNPIKIKCDYDFKELNRVSNKV